MPSKHPPIQFRPGAELGAWIDQQRQPDESPGMTARRLLSELMEIGGWSGRGLGESEAPPPPVGERII